MPSPDPAARFPRLIPVRQRFVSRPVRDIREAVTSAFRKSGVLSRINPGDTVAVTAGSRGISNYRSILRAVVDELKEAGAVPFVVPAMGSHGGATAEGQARVLAQYGITPESVGCPIASSMDVVEVARSPQGVVAYVDKHALSARHIVLFNRIKPHTDFVGKIESGLVKMMCIGLGKHRGALHYHQAGIDLGFEQALRVGARLVLSRAPILCGVAVVEDGYDQTALIEVVKPEEIFTREEHLLALAKEWAPKLPFQKADVLIVDWIGKNISGNGMDSKVIGRIGSPYSAEPEWPKITRIVALNVTPESEGNCTGIGNADFTTRRLVEQMDRESTYTNSVTAQCPRSASVPPYYDTDVEVLEQCFATIGLVEPSRARVIRIRDTLHLGEVWVSEAYARELENREDLEVLGPPQPMRFDEHGQLVPL